MIAALRSCQRTMPFVFLVLALLGCATSIKEPVGNEAGTLDLQPRYSLDVFLNNSGVTILGTSPYDPMNAGLEPVSADTPNSLHWVIRSEEGKVLAQGYVPDPRMAIVEKADDGHGGGIFPAESAMFQLDVPTDKGWLALYENNRESDENAE